MILLILFYLALVILAGFLIALGFYFKSRQLPAPDERRELIYPPDPRLYRPLFAPSDEDVRALEQEKNKQKSEARQEAEKDAVRQRSVLARDFYAVWANAPDRRGAAALLRLAAASESAETFSEISESVLKVWQDEKLEGLTAADMAGLLDSHVRLLPQQEIASGALFWLKQEIAALQNEAEKNNLQR